MKRQARKTTTIGSRQHPLFVPLILAAVWSATNALGQTIRVFPVRSAPLGSPSGTIGSPVTPEFNSGLGCWEVQVTAGVEVDLDIQALGWGDAVGSPNLVAIQSTILPAGYDNSIGGILNPKGWPGNPSIGAYQATRSCSGNGDPCGGQFDFGCDGGINGACNVNPNWVMPPCTNFITAHVTTTLSFAWAVAVQFDCNTDDGMTKTFGGLILDVPLDALGTYVIGFDQDPNDSFMTGSFGKDIGPVPGLTFTPACITIVGANEPGRCCSDIGLNVVCEDVTPQVCSTRPEPRSFAAGETCDGDCACPACLTNADCDDGDQCTADTCNECQCVYTQNCPEIRFFPIRSAPLGSPPGTVGRAMTPKFNDGLGCWELHVASGVEVDIDLQASGWGLAVGSPTLGAICGTVLSAGYSNGVGGILNPKGWPGSPLEGTYQATRSCTDNGDPCASPFDSTCDGGNNGACLANPNWIMPPCADHKAAIATPTLDNYLWCVAAQVACVTDDGTTRTFGGLILDVPHDAEGTYMIALDPDPNDSFMTSGVGTVIENLAFTPACITVTRHTKNRYLTFVPHESGPVGYKLDMVSSFFHPTAIVSGWVGVPDVNGIAALEASPVTREWTEAFVHIAGCEIAPVAEFELRASVDNGATFLPPISLQTTPQPIDGKLWGDIVGIYDGNFWEEANGVTNFNDAFAVIQNWMGHPNAASLPRTDVASQYLNRVVNADDLLFTIFAFKGKTYQFGCPDDPCQDNIENPCP